MLALFEVSLYLDGHIWMGCPLNKSARDGFSPGGGFEIKLLRIRLHITEGFCENLLIPLHIAITISVLIQPL